MILLCCHYHDECYLRTRAGYDLGPTSVLSSGMQPTPVKTIVCPSDSRKPKLSKDGLKRKASGDDSRRKFIKVVNGDDTVAAALTSAHRVDVSSVANHDRTADPVPNGRSRTAFSCGTVRGEKIFLDLKDGHLIEDLERYIKKFGGVIEKFLSKDITCVVTSRVNVVNVRAEERGGVLSPSLVEEKSSKKTECGKFVIPSTNLFSLL